MGNPRARIRADKEGVYVKTISAEICEISIGTDEMLLIGNTPNKQQRDELSYILRCFKNIFAFDDILGYCPIIEHTIRTREVSPIRQKPYRYSPAQRREIQLQISEWLEKGLVVPSNSPWSSQLVLVNKKEGKTRICCDFRALNAATEKDN